MHVADDTRSYYQHAVDWMRLANDTEFSHHHAAINGVHLAGDVGGGRVEGKEAHQSRHLLRLSVAVCTASNNNSLVLIC